VDEQGNMNIKVGDMIKANPNNAVGIVVRISERYEEKWIAIKWMDTDNKAGYTSTYPYDFVFVTTFVKVS